MSFQEPGINFFPKKFSGTIIWAGLIKQWCLCYGTLHYQWLRSNTSENSAALIFTLNVSPTNGFSTFLRKSSNQILTSEIVGSVGRRVGDSGLIPPHTPTGTLTTKCLIFLSIFTHTCGIYPILCPGTPLPLDPGLPPSTQTSPELNCLRPTTQLSKVVFPQPLAPSRP